MYPLTFQLVRSQRVYEERCFVIKCSFWDSNPDSTGLKSVASSVGLKEHCASLEIRTLTEGILSPFPLPIGIQKQTTLPPYRDGPSGYCPIGTPSSFGHTWKPKTLSTVVKTSQCSPSDSNRDSLILKVWGFTNYTRGASYEVIYSSLLCSFLSWCSCLDHHKRYIRDRCLFGYHFHTKDT